MVVGILELTLYYESSHSLKDKRRLSRSVKEKLRNKFNISIIEHNYQDLWQKLGLAITQVASEKKILENSFNRIEEFIITNYSVQIIEISKSYG